MADASQDKADLTNGIPEGDLADGAMLVGQVGDEAVLLARRGQEIFAIGATCTHYGGPLGEGLIVEDTVRCPWHHACFSLRTGEALAAPALNATSSWNIERRDGRIFVRASWSGSNDPTAYKSVARRCALMASSPRILKDRQAPTGARTLCKKPHRSSSSLRVLRRQSLPLA